MAYDTCSLAELINIVNERGLKAPASSTRATKRARYIAILEADDAKAKSAEDAGPPFRFLDLYPELRNRIYTEVLVKQGSSSSLHPQILATCKQIHREANDLLYDGNKFEISMENNALYLYGKEKTCLRWYKDIDWPDFLLRAQNLSLRLDIVEGWNVHDEERVSMVIRLMYSLCSFLGQRHHLRSFMIDVWCPANEDDTRADGLGIRLLPRPRRPTNVDFSVLRLIQKPNLDISIQGTELPQPNFQDPFPEGRRDAATREEAQQFLADAVCALCRDFPARYAAYAAALGDRHDEPNIGEDFRKMTGFRDRCAIYVATTDEVLRKDIRGLRKIAKEVLGYACHVAQYCPSERTLLDAMLAVLRAAAVERVLSKLKGS